MLRAAGAVIGRLGPGFTLADVAGEAGIAAGTLVRRFGSKHGLLVAMSRASTEETRRELRGALAAAGDPVEAVTETLVRRYAPLDDPATAPNHLAQLAFDLADERLRALLAEYHAAVREELEPVLRRAVAAGALPGAPAPRVAAGILTALADGTAVHWSTRPAGSLTERLRTDLGAVIEAWRRPPAGAAREEDVEEG